MNNLAPFVKLYYKDRELPYNIQSFSYVDSEDESDTCEMKIQVNDINAPDEVYFQERIELKVVWGYIGGQITSRKIYADDLKWRFDKRGVTLDYSGSDKASILKQSVSDEMHREGSLPELAAKLGKKHGLEIKIELDSETIKNLHNAYDKVGELGKGFIKQYLDNPETVPLSLASDKLRNEILKSQVMGEEIPPDIFLVGPRSILDDPRVNTSKLTDEQKRLIRQQEKNKFLYDNPGFTQFQQEFNEYRANRVVPPKEWLLRNKRYAQIYFNSNLFNLNNTLNIPQAGKSDHQLLGEMAARQPGNLVLDSRDDGLTIRKRNFNQLPIRQYVFKNSPGDFLSFVPMSRIKIKSKNSSSVGWDSWDSNNKTYHSGTTTSETSPEQTVLSQYITAHPDNPNVTLRDNVVLGNSAGFIPADNTQLVLGPDEYDVNVNDFIKKSKTISDPTAESPDKAKSQAQNVRDNSELKKNPATFLVIGDPGLTVGKLVNIQNVSKKYSGNYYMIKCTHRLTADQGYFVDCEAVTQGNNVKATKDKVSASHAKKEVNKEVNKETKRDLMKRLRNTKNIR